MKLTMAFQMATKVLDVGFQFDRKKMNSRFLSFVRDEEGQSTTEYILILAVVVMVALKFKKEFGGVLNGAVSNLGGKIQQGIDDSSN